MKRYGEGNRLRGLYQFAGASRTNRWAGRAVQTQNLTRTPKIIEEEHRLELATNIIRSGDYDLLDLFAPEPMEIIVGTVRSAFATEEDEEFVVCDLSSIESVVIGYISGCERILQVFRDGKDVYKDFGQVWMRKSYDEITKHERGISKPAVLGAGFRLGGGSLNKEGKRTGLWGYAESMGIDMTREQSHESVRVFRADYAPEIPVMWKDYEDAVMYVMRTGKPKKVGPITFMMEKPYLTILLPSGRRMRYYKPRIMTEKVYTGELDQHGKPDFWTRTGLTYMGVSQITKRWQRIPTHGGKITENVVQAFARDILAEGIRRAHQRGFNIVGHVHDEIITLRKCGDERYSLDALREAMTAPISWAPGIPLGGAGWVGSFYRKD
jgi:DNA polymerase